ncbi:aldehyde dehydrogenase, partial [bacterium]|nr:aldehyde dehydrogenase [bacterium]
GDNGLTLIECSPYGVIGAITPTTNPTETIINNSIGMLAAGNAVVFNPHPRARRCCAYVVHLINEAILACGGPKDLVTIMEHPTMESGKELMEHEGIRVLVVTGGPGLVKAAARSGKKVIGAGPGNPPCVVDETADLDQAAKHLILGATLDNNILCIAEKEVFVVESVADEFMQALKRNNAYHVIGANVSKLENLIYQDNHINADLIGKDASFILSHIDIHTDSSIRMAFMEVDNDHFLVHTEQMMPILPIVRCKDVKEAIDRAIVAEKGCFHTATMHSKNLDNLHEMAVRSEVSIFVKNGPSCAGLGYGGEGFSTMTIAGHTGEGITSARTFTRSRRCVLKGHFRIV